MTRFGWLVISGVIIAALGIALLLWGFARQSAPRLEEENRTPVVDYSTLNIHANGEYGFSIQYPASANVEDAFPEGTASLWRKNATTPGTRIVRFMMASGEVQIGASSDARALASCTESSPAEERLEPQTFGNATWNVFRFDELGTDDEKRVTSYRTIREGQCFALETYELLAGAAISAPVEHVEYVARSFMFAR